MRNDIGLQGKHCYAPKTLPGLSDERSRKQFCIAEFNCACFPYPLGKVGYERPQDVDIRYGVHGEFKATLHCRRLVGVILREAQIRRIEVTG